MKTFTFNSVAISSLLLLSLSAVQAEEISVDNKINANLSGYIGQKSLDDKGWDQQDKQGSIGILFDIKKQNWPVSIAFDVILSGDIDEHGDFKDEVGTVENHIGVRKIFKLSNSSIQPYIGGGIALIGADVQHKTKSTSVSNDDDDTGSGTWVGVGMYYPVNNHFNVGFDLRYSEADVTLFDVDRKAGGMHTGITAGYHW